MAIELWEYAMDLAVLPKPGIMDKGNHPKMALCQVSEIL